MTYAAVLTDPRRACAGQDTELFFPDRGGRVSRARSICARCPVRVECLDYALDHFEVGVWGGLTEEERRAERRRRKHRPSTRACVICREPYQPRIAAQLTCSAKCRRERDVRQRRERNLRRAQR